jgi:D-glucuronyl C5-epimerase C-terminus
MSVRGFTASLGALGAALALVAAAPATSPVPGEKTAFQAVKRAHLDAATAQAARAEIERAVHLIRTLPSGRREHVAVALEELGAFDGRLTQPRALVLVGELKANDDYFSKHYAPADKTDIADDDGLVYRYFAGRCLEFHPLAEFGALNAHVAAQDAEGTQRLADALLARGVYQHGGGIGWEYEFSFGGGRAPWLSGMAQAVAAQALARAAKLVPERAYAYTRAAHAAYALIPRRMLTRVAAGPWIRLYAFSALPVLNAQLQTVLSLQSYASDAHDSGAGALAARMQTSAAEMLSRFDTGYWTYYSLDGTPSPLDYQEFVVQLLKRLSPADPRFAAAATRIAGYAHQPPAFMVTNTSLGALRFWLSKPASVHVVTAAGPAKSLTLYGGWHTLAWGEPKRVGIYPVQVSATDWAGNRAAFQSLPFVRVTAAGHAAASRAASASGPAPAPAFAVGTGIADPSQASLARALGLRLVRLTVAWPAGATEPDPALVASLQSLPADTGLELELQAAPDTSGALAQYAASLAQQVPSLRYLILTQVDAPTFAAVQAAVPGLAVGPLLDGTLTPRAALAQLAGTTPGVVAIRDAPSLTPFTTALQVPVIADGVPASAITGLACNPGVAAAVLDTVDGVDTAALKTSAANAQRGLVVCPGLAIPAAATSLAFPQTPASATFGCARDCLYLVTLDGPDGRPVVARRGALRGGMPPALVALPQAKLKPGAYRLDVRLVNRVNPGPVTQQLSPPLAVG